MEQAGSTGGEFEPGTLEMQRVSRRHRSYGAALKPRRSMVRKAPEPGSPAIAVPAA